MTLLNPRRRRLPVLLAFALVALLAGNGAVTIAAACCSREAAEATPMESCCCSELSCTPETAAGEPMIEPEPTDTHCGCITEPAPVPVHVPAVPTVTERVEIQTPQDGTTGWVAPALDVPPTLAHPPPDAIPLSLTSVSVIVLLI